VDTLIPTSAELAGDPEVIARAEAVRPAVAAASDEIEAKRRLPPHLLDKLHEQKLFRLLMPKTSNGIETGVPRTVVSVATIESMTAQAGRSRAPRK